MLCCSHSVCSVFVFFFNLVSCLHVTLHESVMQWGIGEVILCEGMEDHRPQSFIIMCTYLKWEWCICLILSLLQRDHYSYCARSVKAGP